MADVAAAAGVSLTTVSHVLNKTRPVSDELSKRVLDAAAATGYAPNAIARSLATRRTTFIGVVISSLSNPFFNPMAAHIERVARAHGYTVLITENHENAADEVRQVTVMLDRQVDGLLIAPAANDVAPVLDKIAQSKTPTVLIDRNADLRFDEVGVENIGPTAELVNHVASLGHSRIGLISGRPGLSTTQERIVGYKKGLEESGLALDLALVRSGRSEIDPARRVIKKLMSLPDPPTAILAANNAMTIGALRGLRDLGLRVPHDIALVGFDDFEWADLMQPALTTIRQPVDRIAARATEILIRRIQGDTRPVSRVTLQPKFIHRESCGCSISWKAQ